MTFRGLKKFPYKVPVLTGLLLVILATTVILIREQMDPRSRAAYFTTCQEVAPLALGAKPDRNISISQLEATTKTVEEVAKSSSRTFAPAPNSFKTAVTQRKELLVKTMRENPRAALEQVLDTQQQAQTQILSDNCAEETTVVEGTLDVFIADYEDGTSKDFYILTTDSNEKISVHPTTDTAGVLESNSRVQVSGWKVDHDMIADTSKRDALKKVRGPQSLIPKADAAVAHAQGQQSVLFVLAKFQSSSQPSFSQSQMNTMMFDTIDNYYRENSYDNTSLTGNTTAWTTIADVSTCDTNTIANRALSAVDPNVNFTQYSRVVIMAWDAAQIGCAFEGLGSVGKTTLNTGDGQVSASISWIMAKSGKSTLGLLTLATGHELGHNFGVRHASTLNCGSQALAASGCNTTSLEYGDSFNIMGRQVAHMNAPHKEYIGWLSPSQIRTVTTSGQHTIEPIETKTSGVKAIKIARGGGDFLYVEYRQPIGIDGNLGAGKTTDVYDGGLVHVLLNPIQTALIDTSPPLNPLITYTPALTVGSTLTDPVSGVTIRTVSANSSGMTVEVAFPGTTLPPTTTTPTGTVTGVPTTTTTTTPTGTVTQSPTATLPAGAVSLEVSARLRGIGSGTGNNSSPQVTNVIGQVEVYNQQNQKVHGANTDMLYTAQTGTYKGTVNTALQPGKYTVKLRFRNTLWKQVGAILDLRAGSNALPVAQLVLGDFDQNNELNMQDYSFFVGCYGTKQCSTKYLADLNFDGAVDGGDYNILVASFATRSGD